MIPLAQAVESDRPVPVCPVTNLFAAISNAIWNNEENFNTPVSANRSPQVFSEGALRLNTNTMPVEDFFMAENVQFLDNNDLDVGTSGKFLLKRFTHLARSMP